MANNNNLILHRLRASYLSSIISIALVLLIVGLMSIVAANAGNVAEYFKENMTVSVILKYSVTEEQAIDMAASLEAEEYVINAQYISKEQGAAEMEALLGEDFLDVFESSPIPISIDLHLDGNVVSTDSLAVISQHLMEDSKVEEVTYQESLVEMMNANMKQIGTLLAVTLLLLFFISFALIGNTVRLNVFSSRFTIHTMRLVGAKKYLICKPFVLRAMILGAASGVIADIIILCLLSFSGNNMDFIKSILDMRLNCLILVGLLFLGMIICGISAIFVTSRLVDMSKDELYY